MFHINQEKCLLSLFSFYINLEITYRKFRVSLPFSLIHDRPRESLWKAGIPFEMKSRLSRSKNCSLRKGNRCRKTVLPVCLFCPSRTNGIFTSRLKLFAARSIFYLISVRFHTQALLVYLFLLCVFPFPHNNTFQYDICQSIMHVFVRPRERQLPSSTISFISRFLRARWQNPALLPERDNPLRLNDP